MAMKNLVYILPLFALGILSTATAQTPPERIVINQPEFVFRVGDDPNHFIIIGLESEHSRFSAIEIKNEKATRLPPKATGSRNLDISAPLGLIELEDRTIELGKKRTHANYESPAMHFQGMPKIPLTPIEITSDLSNLPEALRNFIELSSFEHSNTSKNETLTNPDDWVLIRIDGVTYSRWSELRNEMTRTENSEIPFFLANYRGNQNAPEFVMVPQSSVERFTKAVSGLSVGKAKVHVFPSLNNFTAGYEVDGNGASYVLKLLSETFESSFSLMPFVQRLRAIVAAKHFYSSNEQEILGGLSRIFHDIDYLRQAIQELKKIDEASANQHPFKSRYLKPLEEMLAEILDVVALLDTEEAHRFVLANADKAGPKGLDILLSRRPQEGRSTYLDFWINWNMTLLREHHKILGSPRWPQAKSVYVDYPGWDLYSHLSGIPIASIFRYRSDQGIETNAPAPLVVLGRSEKAGKELLQFVLDADAESKPILEREMNERNFLSFVKHIGVDQTNLEAFQVLKNFWENEVLTNNGWSKIPAVVRGGRDLQNGRRYLAELKGLATTDKSFSKDYSTFSITGPLADFFKQLAKAHPKYEEHEGFSAELYYSNVLSLLHDLLTGSAGYQLSDGTYRSVLNASLAVNELVKGFLLAKGVGYTDTHSLAEKAFALYGAATREILEGIRRQGPGTCTSMLTNLGRTPKP